MAYSFFPNDFYSHPNLQENATMNYLTQHYKNLSEQLQAKVNDLNQLLEKVRTTEKVRFHGAERDEGEYHPTLQGTLTGKGAKGRRQVDVEPGRAIVGVSKETEIQDAHELADDDADKNNIYRTGRPLKVNKSEIRRVVETADLGVRDTQDVLLHLNIVKNLSEQLRAKVNRLQNLISEAQKETEDVIIDDAERDEGEYHPTLQGRLAKGKGSKRGRQVNIEPGRAIVGVSKETEIGDAHELADDDADKNNIYKTGKALKVNKSEIRRV